MYHHLFMWRFLCGRKISVFFFGFILASPIAVFAEPASGARGLTLPEAVAEALRQNPILQVFTPRLEGLQGKRLTADQNPAIELGLTADNILGVGQYSDTKNSEYTLTLSSLIELGGKRQARVKTLSGRYALVELERKAQALTLLGDVTRAFILALSLQEKREIGREALRLAESSLTLVKKRVEIGAAPEAEALRAQSQLDQALLDSGKLQAAFDSSLMELATLLGRAQPDFNRLEGDLYAFDVTDNFDGLFQRASSSPEIRVFASEERLREAELNMARSLSRSDIRWQVGARYLEESGDSALVLGASIPLFSGRRNRGDVQAAMAARDEVGYRREDAMLSLRARLYRAFRSHRQSIITVDALQSKVLPNLRKAQVLTRKAYEKGRYGYMEWRLAQEQLLTAQRQLVDAAATAFMNQALIEQLTGQSLASVDDDY